MAASVARLIVEWSTPDLQLAAVLKRIAAYSEHSAERMELEATLHAAWAACALRGGLGSWRALRQTIGNVAGVVVLRSIDRSERVAIAQALRGAGYPKPDATEAAASVGVMDRP